MADDPKAETHVPKASAPTGPPDPPPPADVALPPFIASLQAEVPGSVARVSYYLGDWTVIVPVSHILQAVTRLRDAPDAAFDLCSDVTATDRTLASGAFVISWIDSTAPSLDTQSRGRRRRASASRA